MIFTFTNVTLPRIVVNKFHRGDGADWVRLREYHSFLVFIYQSALNYDASC